MKTIMAFMLLASTAAGQSFVVTERSSFVVTDRVTSPPAVEIVKTKTRTRYLVSEDWCVHCRPVKEKFIAFGWPESNVITNAECRRRFGFTAPSLPYIFEEPETSQPQPRSGASSCNCSAACTCGCQSGEECDCGSKTKTVSRSNTMSHSDMVHLHDALHGGGSHKWPGDLRTHLKMKHGVEVD